MKSIWNNKNSKKLISKDINGIESDILIIGAGITGLSCSYFLKDCNKKIILIDKESSFLGVTSKSTAKITYLQGIIYQVLEKNFDIYAAREYLNSQLDAIKYINDIIKTNNISCDFEKSSSLIFTTKIKGKKKIQKEKELLEKWGIKFKEICDKNMYGIEVEGTYTFNPVKYLEGLYNILKNKINIYGNVMANDIKYIDNKYIIETNMGIIKAQKVIIACHYPFFIKPAFIPLKTYIKREYVNAGSITNPKKFNAINIDKKLYSIRYYKNYVIYASNSHKLTSKTNYKINYQKSIKDYKNNFKKEPEFTWMNQDIMSNDSLPFIGEIKKDLYMATAFNSWGITNGTISGKIISDLIINNDSKYKLLFNPKRNNFPLLKDSFIGTFSYLKVILASIFKKNKPFYIKIKNIIYGIYIDDNNKKHIVRLICPHMKCNLIFNKQEKTWDCPCHGSRFDLDGNIIEGPATKGIDI